MRTPVSTVGRALRRRAWLILLITLAGGAAAYEASVVRPPVYEAGALVSIDESSVASQGVDVAMQADQFLTQRYIAMGTSREVMLAVCAKEGHGCDATALGRQVKVTTPRATAQLQIVADASSPATAARLANEVADALIARNRTLADQDTGAERTFLQDQLKQQGDQLSQQQQLVAANEAAARPDAAGLSQLTFLQTQYATTFQRLQELDLQRTRRANVLSVQQRAVAPRAPFDPDPVRYVAVGLVGGLVAGLLAALLTGGLRSRIRRSSDLAEVAGTDAVVDFSRNVLRGAGRPYAYLARISLSALDERPAMLLVGSTLGERVNEVGRELADVVAASGRRVLLLPAPETNAAWWRRRPAQLPKVIVEPDDPGGQLALRPADDIDLVIHCSLPPMLDPSATWLRSTPDSAILVATRGVTRFGEARRTVDMLDRAGVQVIAAILLPLRLARAPLTAALGRPLQEPKTDSAEPAPTVVQLAPTAEAEPPAKPAAVEL